MRQSSILNNFVGGEVSPKMRSRSDSPLYKKSLARCENMLIQIQGGLRKRNGTAFVHTTRLNKTAVLIPFQFNDTQAYLIEATDTKFRFYANNGVVLGNDALITNISNAATGVFVAPAHGFSVADQVLIDDVNGVSGLNGIIFVINTVPNANRFTLKTLAGAVVNTIGAGKYKNGGKATKVITVNGITSANPGVVTANGHGFTTGDEIFISGVQGLTQLNGRFFLVNVTGPNTFTLTDIFGTVINTLGLGPYTTGGTVAKIFEVTTVFTEDDLPNIQFAQSIDTMYLANQNYTPQQLVRNSAANFTISAQVRTSDPFTGPNFPKCVAFIPGTRLGYADTPDKPQSIWSSKAPSTGNTAFNNFTTGTNATDAVYFTLAPSQGKADTIQWIATTNQYAFLGVFGGLRSLYGAQPTDGIDPNDINALPVSFFGCAPILPVATGENLFYVQRGNRIVRGLAYDISINGNSIRDLTLFAEHLTVPLVQQLMFQQGAPDVLWARLGNGKLCGLSFSSTAAVEGWHRHRLGGNSIDTSNDVQPYGNVLALGSMARPSANEQLWAVVERQINGKTVRSVEYVTDPIDFPHMEDFFTTPDTQSTDLVKWQNAMFEAQKNSNHLDMATFYDGSAQGQISMTPGAVTGNTITFVASAPFFTADMAANNDEIWKQYDPSGNGGGKAKIISITDSTHAVCNITKNFDSVAAMAPGTWYLAVTKLTGLDLWNGETLNVVADGAVSADTLIANGTITLGSPATKVGVGYKFPAIVSSLELETNGVNGTTRNANRKIAKAAIELLETNACMIGTSLYSLQPVGFRETTDPMDRPIPLKSKTFEEILGDSYEKNKQIHIYSNVPLPLNILSMELFFDSYEDAAGQK